MKTNYFFLMTLPLIIILSCKNIKEKKEISSSFNDDTIIVLENNTEEKEVPFFNPVFILEQDKEYKENTALWALRKAINSEFFLNFIDECKGLSILSAKDLNEKNKFFPPQKNEPAPKWVVGFAGRDSHLIISVYPDGKIDAFKAKGNAYPDWVFNQKIANSDLAIEKALFETKVKRAKIFIALFYYGNQPVWKFEIVDTDKKTIQELSLHAVNLTLMHKTYPKKIK